MKMEVRFHRIQNSDSLSRYIERRIQFALSRFGNKISAVTVRLEDLNGPKGGLDKKCQIIIRLKSRMLILEGVEENIYTAIDLTAERAQRQVTRTVNRLQTVRLKQAASFSGFAKRKSAA